MGAGPIAVLLVGEGVGRSSHLVQWLAGRHCNCQFAPSYRDACDSISRTEFEVVLSQYQLPDRTAFPLLEWLAGSTATLFFSARVENGFLWLKMLERGQRCVGAPALRSDPLIALLDDLFAGSAFASAPAEISAPQITRAFWKLGPQMKTP